MSNEKKKNNECNRFSVIHWLYKNWNWVRIYSLFPQKTPPPATSLPGAWLKSGKSKPRRLKMGSAARRKHQRAVAPLCSARCFVRSAGDTFTSHLFIYSSRSATRTSCVSKNICQTSVFTLVFCDVDKSNDIGGGPRSHSAELQMKKESHLSSMSAIAAGVRWWWERG